MGLDDFDTVVGYIDYAIKAAVGRGKVYVKAVGAKDLIEKGEVEEFVRRWGGAYQDGGHAFVHLEGNWAGKTWPLRIVSTTPCERALDQIMVLWDGRVTGCCHMGEGEMIFGDLNTHTLREVYTSVEHVAFRQAHAEGRRGTIPTCAACTSI
jgi:radical SAM protein with 4Fe4S-binding SPASM domain